MSFARPRTVVPWLAGLAAVIAVPAAIAGAGAPPQNGEIAFAVHFDTGQLYSVRHNAAPVQRLTTDLDNNWQPVASPDGRKIAFIRGSLGSYDIYSMNRDGSGLVNLTRSAGDDYDPMWSPDGRRIAFTSHRSGDDETYVMNENGTGTRRVTRSRGEDENPTWLDSKRLVISRVRKGQKKPQIYLVTIANGRAVRLTNDRFYNQWPQASPNGHWIAYTRNKYKWGSGDIVVMRADGRGAKAITSGTRDDAYPSWSRDSRRLVYTRSGTLYLIDRDGGHNEPVQPYAAGGDPFWASDGTIYFDNSDYDNPEIAVVGAQGGQFRLLTEAAEDDDVEPFWSPDGSRLLFQSDRNGDDEIWIMDRDGKNVKNLSQAPRADDGEPAWTPDGSKIAFSSNRGSAHNDAEIVVMNADGSDQVSISRSPADDYAPSWSPDGRRIAFSRFAGEKADVWVMNADGTNQVRLTTSDANDDEPSWSPDGTKILFMSTRDGMPSIYVMNTDGSDQHLLVKSGEIDSEPSWSPDGTKIVFDRQTRQGIEIVVADADGSNQRVVSLACFGNCDEDYPPDPSWQPLR